MAGRFVTIFRKDIPRAVLDSWPDQFNPPPGALQVLTDTDDEDLVLYVHAYRPDDPDYPLREDK